VLQVHKDLSGQVPGNNMQVDVKFLRFCDRAGTKIRRFQHIAIGDATRLRALKVYRRQTQENAIKFMDHVIAMFLFRMHGAYREWPRVSGQVPAQSLRLQVDIALEKVRFSYRASIVSRRISNCEAGVPLSPKEAICRTAFDQPPLRARGRLNCHGTALLLFYYRLFHYRN
jgi:hypothetical protein